MKLKFLLAALCASLTLSSSAAAPKPLRVFDGFLNLATTTVDSEGYAHTGTTRVAIHPEGDETDFTVGEQIFRFRDFWFLASDGTLRMEHRDDDIKGQVAVLERAPEAMIGLLRGENLGKMLVRIS